MDRLWWAGPAGSARPINFSCDGPWPGPAHQFFVWWAAARPSPSHLKKITAWPGPPHDIGGEALETRAQFISTKGATIQSTAFDAVIGNRVVQVHLADMISGLSGLNGGSAAQG